MSVEITVDDAEVEESVAPQDDVVEKPVAEEAETAEESETSQDDVAKPEEEEEEKKPEQKKGGFQRRIEKLQSRIQQTEEEKDYWRNKALRIPEPEKVEAKETPKETKRPKLDDFKGEDAVQKWEDAMDAYTKVEAKRIAAETFAELQKESNKKTADERAAEAWEEKVEAAKEKHDDFMEVTSSLNGKLTPVISQVLLKSEIGPEVGYFLASHPDELKKIAKIKDVVDVARAIGQIEGYIADLETEDDSKQKEPAKKKETPVSKAPPPLSSTRKVSSTTVDLENLPPAEYRKVREAHLKGK